MMIHLQYGAANTLDRAALKCENCNSAEIDLSNPVEATAFTWLHCTLKAPSK